MTVHRGGVVGGIILMTGSNMFCSNKIERNLGIILQINKSK